VQLRPKSRVLSSLACGRDNRREGSEEEWDFPFARQQACTLPGHHRRTLSAPAASPWRERTERSMVMMRLSTWSFQLLRDPGQLPLRDIR